MTHPDAPRGDQAVLAVKLIGPVPQPPVDVYGTVYQTVILQPPSAGNLGGEEILPASPARLIAWILAIDDDIFVSDNRSDAEASKGSFVPKALSAWTPIQDSGAVYAFAPTMAGASSRVSVMTVYRSKG